MYEQRSKKSELEVGDMKLIEIRAAFQARMTKLCHGIADRKAGRGVNWKLRVRSIAQALGISWSRAKSYYYEESRRIDVEEFYVTQQTHEKLELKAIELQAIRGMEMGLASRDFLDSADHQPDSGLGRNNLPTSREMAQEMKIRLAGV